MISKFGFNKKSKKLRKKKKQQEAGGTLYQRVVEDNMIHTEDYSQYRDKVRKIYGGTQGAFLKTVSTLSLHLILDRELLRRKKFDLTGCKNILDVGSGVGQLAKPVLRYGDPDLQLTCIDLSPKMLQRAKQQLKDDRPQFVVADMYELPFEDETFDTITCGYVLEHVPDAEAGLAEMARVMQTGGRMLLLATEDSLMGSWNSRFWKCQTYNRRELFKICRRIGLRWEKELWFSPFHKLTRSGGIIVEIVKESKGKLHNKVKQEENGKS